MYSPSLERFLSQDPYVEGQPDILHDNNWFGDRLTMMRNLYGYADNNPVNAIEPKGTLTIKVAFEWGRPEDFKANKPVITGEFVLNYTDKCMATTGPCGKKMCKGTLELKSGSVSLTHKGTNETDWATTRGAYFYVCDAAANQVTPIGTDGLLAQSKCQVPPSTECSGGDGGTLLALSSRETRFDKVGARWVKINVEFSTTECPCVQNLKATPTIGPSLAPHEVRVSAKATGDRCI